LKMGFGPVTVLAIKCCLDVVYLIIRLIFMKAKIALSLREFLTGTMLPIFFVSVLCFVGVYFASGITKSCSERLIVTTSVFLVFYVASVVFIALNKKERMQIYSFVAGKLKKV